MRPFFFWRKIMEFTSLKIASSLSLAAFVISLLMYLEIVESYNLNFNYDLIIKDKEYWRLFTSLLHFGPLKISKMYSMYNFYTESSEIENHCFMGRPLDFILFILFGCVTLWIYAAKTGILFLGDAFSFYFTYYWSKMFPSNRFLILVFHIPIAYYPIFYFCFLVLPEIGNPEFVTTQAIPILLMTIVAQTYFFLHDVIYVKYDVPIFKFPMWANRFANSLIE